VEWGVPGMRRGHGTAEWTRARSWGETRRRDGCLLYTAAPAFLSGGREVGKEGQGGRRHQLVLELIVGLGWVGFGLAAVLVGFPCLVVQYTVQVGTSGLKKMLSVSQPRSPFI
jgi:hypothetical protein